MGYHILVVVLLIASAIYNLDPGSWRTAEFQREMLFIVAFYPVLIPALMICGGLHDRCESILGRATQWVVLGSTIAWWVAGWCVVASMAAQRLRQYTSRRREHV